MTSADKLNQLIKARQQFIACLYSIGEESAPIFDTISRLGLRFIEAYDLKNWEKKGEETYILNTVKHSEKRIFTANELPGTFRELIDQNIETSSQYSYRTLSRIYAKYFKYPYAKVKNKNCKTHIFRHIKALELKRSGLSDIEIQKYFGHKNIKSTLEYTENDITL
jgi:integrase